jgi:phosphoenolpyruvate carboxylase
LGKTPFFKHEKPSPFDEAVSLIWYLENVFYHAVSRVFNYIQHNIFYGKAPINEIIDLGFWPGGDRDGNPFVTHTITLDVAKRLHQTVLKNYYRDIRKLKRKLTFAGVEERINALERVLFENSVDPESVTLPSLDELKTELQEIRKLIVEKHHSLYIEELDDLINKVNLFGYHFASLDLRQDSRVHHQVYEEVVDRLIRDKKLAVDFRAADENDQFEQLQELDHYLSSKDFDEGVTRQTLGAIEALKTIQEQNGEQGANRYIISNCQSARNVLELLSLIKLTGDSDPVPVDIIPLFETVDDLKESGAVMDLLYTHPVYRKHLEYRGLQQTIMLGFSDGTKDGGYLMANWSIFRAKEVLTAISRNNGVQAVFFDGRGGPPARGGGKTHRFYASLGPTVEDDEIQLTVQGQTISSNFGTLDACQYNLEQLLSAGISNELFSKADNILTKNDRELMQDLAETSYQAYVDFKNHPSFLPYLEQMSTLKYYARTNIGSRPVKRASSDNFKFSDLRAIPFVGSWSQLKQNVPGFYGVGTALKKYEEAGEFIKVKKFYKNSDFFKTLVKNSMMSLSKSFFPLTAYMADDPKFGSFWKLIHEEYQTTRRLLLKLTGYDTLMQRNPVGKASIDLREDIVLPLITIQQYAMVRIRELERESQDNRELLAIYEKMVTRSLFGNINASRNSA